MDALLREGLYSMLIKLCKIVLLPEIAILAGMLTAGVVAFTYGYWIEMIPKELQVTALTFIPITATYFGVAIPFFWRLAVKRETREEEPDHLEKFVVSVEYISQEWHHPLEIAESLLDQCGDLFSKINEEIGLHYSHVQEPQNLHLMVPCTITADCLRITDSILSQVRSGHPDTAMGTARQLFELSAILEVISLDKTGERGRRYQDFNELRYLEDCLRASSSREEKERNGRRMATIRQRYQGRIDFGTTYGWAGIQGEMRELLRYLEREKGHAEPNERETTKALERQWVALTNWSHISKAASMRKLGTRTESGYLEAHLVEKSRVGLDVPISIAMGRVFQVLSTYAHIAQNLTNVEHNQELSDLLNLVKEVASSIESVPAELRANDFVLAFRSSEKATD